MVPVQSAANRLTLATKIAATLACLVELAETAISIILAADGSLTGYFARLALAASAADAANFIIFVCFFAMLSLPSPNAFVLCLWFSALTVWFFGSVFSLIVFGLTVATPSITGRVATGVHDLALAGLAAGAVGLIPQAVLAILVWLQLERRRLQPIEVVNDQTEAIPPPKDKPASVSVASKRVPPTLELPKWEKSPRSVMEWPESPTSFLRDSVRRAISPIIARSKTTPSQSPVVTRPSAVYTKPFIPLDVVRQDGFESWDTSSVAAHFEQPSRSSVPARSVLETIPGSRPMSLISALEHLEPETRPSERGMPLPDSPTYPTVSMSFHGNLANFYPPLSARRGGGVFVDSSRRHDRSHVHPLSHAQSNNVRFAATPDIITLQQPKRAPSKKQAPPRPPRPSQSLTRMRSPSLVSRVDSSRSYRTHSARPQQQNTPSDQKPQRYGSQLSKLSVIDGEKDECDI